MEIWDGSSKSTPINKSAVAIKSDVFFSFPSLSLRLIYDKDIVRKCTLHSRVLFPTKTFTAQLQCTRFVCLLVRLFACLFVWNATILCLHYQLQLVNEVQKLTSTSATFFFVPLPESKSKSVIEECFLCLHFTRQ